MSDEKRAMVYLTVINQFLKVNGFRIASHSLQKTETPLSARTDLKPLLPLVQEGDDLDILGLDGDSKITLCKVYYNEQLSAHYKGDEFFINAIKRILSTNLEDVHFCFITNGIVMPELIQKTNWETNLGISLEELNRRIPVIEFYETRVNVDMLAKLSDQKVYTRNIISKTKRLHDSYTESDVEYENEPCLEGKYDIMYQGKIQTFPYWISASGVQLEAPDNGERIGEFVSGFR
jgi:hypothetical protein